MKILFWDVDTQRDFIEPKGRLYVPSAEFIRDNLAKITKIGATHGTLSGSVDAHKPDDPEFKDYPPHCIYGTPGQHKIPETEKAKTLYIPTGRLTEEQIQEAVEYKGQVIFEKQSTDLATNPNLTYYIEAIDPSLVIIYGLVSEICVDSAVDYFAGDKGYRTLVVEDAIKELEKTMYQKCRNRWSSLKVEMIETSRLEAYIEQE